MSRHIDKAELISKLQTLEGLTVDERSSLIGLLREHKKYGLVWEDKPEDVEERLRDSLPVLREVKDKAIMSDEPDAPNHILIEGDNLEALTALSYTHEGKIDVIYIDPPYNTGNKDEGAFIYNDRIIDEEDAFIHSKWLSFMSRRLKVAKKLLKPNGVLFISIGDAEVANLKLLCDDFFSCLGVIPRIAKKGSNQGTWFRPTKDYVIVCAIRKEQVQGFVSNSDTAKSKDYPLIEDYTGRHYRKAHSLFQASLDPLRGCKNQRYYIEAPDGTLIIPPGPHLPSQDVEGGLIIPITGDDKVWRWSKDSFLQKKNRIMFAKSKQSPLIDSKGKHTDWNVYEKKYEDEELKKDDNTLPDDVIYEYLNSLATTLLNEMGIKFPFSKPYQLVKYLISITNKSSSITILDFFAGSGTTLHATMQLNEEDGGHRQCILVTNNENNICEEVTYERNKRVINGYTTPKGQKVEGLKRNTLRYYKTDYISRERTQKNMRDLVAAATDLLCIKEDLYEEQPTFGRFKLKPQLARYFRSSSAGLQGKNDGRKHMLIIYREELIDEIAEEIKRLSLTPDPSPKERGVGKLKIYVFSPGRYPFTDNFREVEDKVELVALPAAIYDAYQKVLPKRKEKLFAEATEEQETKIPADLFEGQGV